MASMVDLSSETSSTFTLDCLLPVGVMLADDVEEEAAAAGVPPLEILWSSGARVSCGVAPRLGEDCCRSEEALAGRFASASL